MTASEIQSPEAATVRVFVVDDHELVRFGIARALMAEPDLLLVGEAETAAQALAAIPEIRPDVAVLDERLPDASGTALCRQLRDLSPATRCILFTGFNVPIMHVTAEDAGAYGCVFKTSPLDELFVAIRRVADGDSLWAAGRQGVPPPHPADRLAGLTPREHHVLGMLAEAKTNGEIASELGLAEQTVKNFVSRLLAKTGFSSRSDAAVYMVRLQKMMADSGPWVPGPRTADHRPVPGNASGSGASGPRGGGDAGGDHGAP